MPVVNLKCVSIINRVCIQSVLSNDWILYEICYGYTYDNLVIENSCVMCVIRWFLIKSCIFGVYISLTEASVSLRTFDGEKAYLKDTPVTLVCTITPYNNEMTWYVDNDPYADCFLGTCGPSPNKPYTFQFDFDESAGVFNLTIDSVNYAHAQLSFACDDGNVRETISFNVTTDKGQNPSSTTHTSNSPTKPGINNQITVTSEHNNDNGDSPVSTGDIIGIVIGIVVFLILVTGLIIFVYRWRKRKGQIKERKGQIEEIKALLLRLLNLQRNNRSHVQELLKIKGLSEEIKIEANNRLSTMNWGDKIKLYKDINEEEWRYKINTLEKERDTIIDEQIWMIKQQEEKKEQILIEEKVKITEELEQMKIEGKRKNIKVKHSLDTTDEQRSMKEREKERKLNQRLAEKTKELELVRIQEGKSKPMLPKSLEQEVNKEIFEKSILQDPARYETFSSFIVREIVEKEKCFDDIIKRALDKDPDAFEKMKSDVETKLQS